MTVTGDSAHFTRCRIYYNEALSYHLIARCLLSFTYFAIVDMTEVFDEFDDRVLLKIRWKIDDLNAGAPPEKIKRHRSVHMCFIEVVINVPYIDFAH